MPRRERSDVRVVHRTARIRLRATPAQRRRCYGQLLAAGDVWAACLDMNRWRRQRGLRPVVSYQELCRELSAAGPGTFGELSSDGARSVLRRYSDAWFSTAQRRRAGDASARYPRRKRHLMPVRFYGGTFRIDGQRLRLPAARGCPPLVVRLVREVPYPAGWVRSVTLLADGGHLWVDVAAEVPVTAYPEGAGPDPGRVAGVDLGVIHPYAVAGPEGQGLIVSGRALRAEHHLHHKDQARRSRALASRAPKPGQKGSRRWRKHRTRQRKAEARHQRRIRQAQHEASATVVAWLLAQRIGTLKIGDPRGVLNLQAGRRHNRRLRDASLGRLIKVLAEDCQVAGITTLLVDERGTSSTRPACQRRVPKPRGRLFTCPHPECGYTGHRDLVGAANIAPRTPGSGPTTAPIPPGTGAVVTHRRAGRHLPGAGPSRRDPRRRPHHDSVRGSPGAPSPAPPDTGGESLAHARITKHRQRLETRLP